VQLEPRMFREPSLDLLGLVGRIIIDNQVKIEMFGHGPLDRLQEADELLGPMPRQAFADHLSGLHIQSRE
jgi:hypothetical protein